jgi:hypothetical protein
LLFFSNLRRVPLLLPSRFFRLDLCQVCVEPAIGLGNHLPVKQIFAAARFAAATQDDSRPVRIKREQKSPSSIRCVKTSTLSYCRDESLSEYRHVVCVAADQIVPIIPTLLRAHPAPLEAVHRILARSRHVMRPSTSPD